MVERCPAVDRMLAHRPVRIRHRTGALWMVNSLAIARLRLASDLVAATFIAGSLAYSRGA